MNINKVFNINVNSSKSLDLNENDIYSLIEPDKEYIPVISSKTKDNGIIGYIPKPNINLKDYSENAFVNINGVDYFINIKGAITVTKDGYSGFMFLRNCKDYPIFAISHSYIFSPKKDINLEWFICKYQSKFTKHNQKGKVNHFTQKIYSKIEIDIPTNDRIQLELKSYSKLKKIENKIDCILEKIDKIINQEIEFNIKNTYILRDLFSYIGENRGLTETNNYKLQPAHDSGKVAILGGGGNIISYIDEKHKTIPTIIKNEIKQIPLKTTKDVPIFCVITRGDAGSLFLYKPGNYANNPNSYTLYFRNEAKIELGITNIEDEYDYMLLIKNILENKFKNFTSSNALSVFPISEVLKNKEIEIELPYYTKDLKSLITKIKLLKEKELFLKSKKSKIIELLDKDLIE